MTRSVKKLLLYVFIIASPVAPTVMLIERAARASQGVSSPNEATNAAFRDGLYQGQLAAEQGREPRPTSGRWKSEQDRASFIAGYQQGYPMISTARDASVVSGKVTVEGQPSKPKAINMSAEP